MKETGTLSKGSRPWWQRRDVALADDAHHDSDPKITERGTVDEILDVLLTEKRGVADHVIIPSSWMKVDKELLERTFH